MILLTDVNTKAKIRINENFISSYHKFVIKGWGDPKPKETNTTEIYVGAQSYSVSESIEEIDKLIGFNTKSLK